MDYIILSYYYISSSIVHHIQFKYCKNASCKSVTLSPRSTLSQPMPAQAQMGSFLETMHFQAKPIWQSTIISTNQETPIYYESHLSSL